MARGMSRLAARDGYKPPANAPAADRRIWDFDEAAAELLALISEESGIIARTRAQQIIWGLRKLVK